MTCQSGSCAIDPLLDDIEGNVPIECSNLIDDDGDSRTDCEDDNCRWARFDEDEITGGCSDGRDNDCDHRTDCDDHDCHFDPACP